jgi:hypothetical protein
MLGRANEHPTWVCRWELTRTTRPPCAAASKLCHRQLRQMSIV